MSGKTGFTCILMPWMLSGALAAGPDASRAATAEAALKPEQKADRAKREAEMKAMRAEMAPLRERLAAATSEAERIAILDAMRQVREKYSRR